MEVLTALAFFNSMVQAGAYFLDVARQGGATPEQIAAARQQAIDEYDAVAAAIAASEPPTPSADA